jgi:hypothetical protein
VALCQVHPVFARAQMIRIRSTAQEVPYAEILESVPTAVRSDPEVVLALHDRAAAEDRFVEAEQILRGYPDLATGWLSLRLALACTLLEQQYATGRITGRGLIPANPDFSPAAQVYGFQPGRAARGLKWFQGRARSRW